MNALIKEISYYTKQIRKQKLFFLITFLLISPIVFYGFFSSIQIPSKTSYIEKDWMKFNQPDWIIKQTIATYVFSITVISTLLFWKYRLSIAMLGVAILLVTNLVSLNLMITYMNIPVILFLMTMMFIMHYIDSLGFFKSLLHRVLALTNFDPKLLFIAIMVMSAVMAALVDEVTSIIFISILIFNIAKKFKLNPIPFLFAAIMATNIGSSATVIGNPVGVYTAFFAGLTFKDFLIWTTPAAILSLTVIILLMLRFEKRFLCQIKTIVSNSVLSKRLKKKFLSSKIPKKGAILFLITILFIVTHHEIEEILGLTTNTLLVALPLLVAFLILLTEGEKAGVMFEKCINWSTLIFFMFLFAKAATLEYTGATTKVSVFLIDKLIPSEPTILSVFIVFIILTVTVALLSAALDNVVAVAVFLPIAREIVSLALPQSQIFWWAVVIGSVYGGNLTHVGSTANIVALCLLEKEYKKTITLDQWIKKGLIITILTLLVAMGYIMTVAFLSNLSH
jgi:Na+/H+ antiporter NhaD/arsenite permease-like protein